MNATGIGSEGIIAITTGFNASGQDYYLSITDMSANVSDFFNSTFVDQGLGKVELDDNIVFTLAFENYSREYTVNYTSQDTLIPRSRMTLTYRIQAPSILSQYPSIRQYQ